LHGVVDGKKVEVPLQKMTETKKGVEEKKKNVREGLSERMRNE
jgi:hypothetical protein